MYIVLEGIDGAGKSTQTELLNDWLTGKGYRTKKIVEPTTSDIGKVIRKELLNPESTNDINQQRLTLLFAADRLTLKKEILDAKDSKDIIIISDRSFYSSICYQNNSSVDKDWIYEVNLHTPRPDLTILLDLDEKEAITRCDREEAFENIIWETPNDEIQGKQHFLVFDDKKYIYDFSIIPESPAYEPRIGRMFVSMTTEETKQ